MNDERLLIIDASLNRRIAPMLRNQRLRMALSCADLGVARFNDRALLRFLHSYWPGTVLVTADDQMPREHGDLIARWMYTLAVIDPLMPAMYRGSDAWHWEIVHRWAHNMQAQTIGTIYRYSDRGRREWRKPRRAAISPPPQAPLDASAARSTVRQTAEYGEQLQLGGVQEHPDSPA